MFLEQISAAFLELISLAHLAYLGLGVCLGLLLGVLPGLGGLAGLSLLLPFVFGMQPSLALAMMLGLQSVTATSDTFPSVLMGIPGTSSSQATTLDGFQMAKKGEGGRALAAAFSASMLGGVFGAILLTGAVFVAEPLILAIGFGEQLMLTLFALTMVGMLTGMSPMKGLASCCIGLMLGAIGATPTTGVVRLGLGTEYLVEPIKIVIIGLALFAVPEIVDLMRNKGSISREPFASNQTLRGIRDVFSNWWLTLRCGLIGSFVGALPGLGGSVVDWIAYGHAMQSTKNPENYGKGDVRGVIAPEAANNAKEGGALIPTLLFGIPGSGSMAVLIGGFFLIGIEPGISLVTQQLDLVYLMIWSVAIANIIGAVICLGFARHIAKLTLIPYSILAPFMIAIIFFAAFQATRSWGDLIMLLVLGTAGVYMKRFGWSRPAVLIGFVLSDRIEETIYQTTAVYGFEVFFRPVVIILGICVVFSIYVAYRAKSQEVERNETNSPQNQRPHLVFLAALALLPLALITDTFDAGYLTKIYPIVAACLGLLFMAVYGIQVLTRHDHDHVFFDLEAAYRERQAASASSESNEAFILWIASIVGISAILGYVLGTTIFIFTFLIVRARVKLRQALFGSVAAIAFLVTLADLMTLRYPTGLLQTIVSLPWPLQ